MRSSLPREMHLPVAGGADDRDVDIYQHLLRVQIPSEEALGALGYKNVPTPDCTGHHLPPFKSPKATRGVL